MLQLIHCEKGVSDGQWKGRVHPNACSDPLHMLTLNRTVRMMGLSHFRTVPLFYPWRNLQSGKAYQDLLFTTFKMNNKWPSMLFTSTQ